MGYWYVTKKLANMGIWYVGMLQIMHPKSFESIMVLKCINNMQAISVDIPPHSMIITLPGDRITHPSAQIERERER